MFTPSPVYLFTLLVHSLLEVLFFLNQIFTGFCLLICVNLKEDVIYKQSRLAGRKIFIIPLSLLHSLLLVSDKDLPLYFPYLILCLSN